MEYLSEDATWLKSQNLELSYACFSYFTLEKELLSIV